METTMKCYGRTLMLRDDPQLIETYKAYHRDVWPEVTARLRDVGVREMRIFLLGTRMFMYVETNDDFDLVRDFGRVNDDPKSKEWDVLMRTLQQPAPEAPPGAWWADMEQVFDLNWEPVSSKSPAR
jgi:L-rhamnose mutarotase